MPNRLKGCRQPIKLLIMKNLKKILFVFLLTFCGKAMAQQILSSDMTVSKPIIAMLINNSPMKMDGVNDKATIRFFTFGNGYITYELEVSGPTVKEICDSREELKGDKLYYTWSGNTNRNLNAMCLSNAGSPMYMVATPSQKMDGMLGCKGNEWLTVITGQVPGCITDVHTGMNLSEITEGMKGLLNTPSVVMNEVGTEGGLKKYTLFGARLQDDAIRDDLTHLKQDDAYAHFWFDEEGKLVKWYRVK